MATVFEGNDPKSNNNEMDAKTLYAQIGQLKIEYDFLKKLQETGDRNLRKTMVNASNKELSIRKQYELLNVPRSSFYYESNVESQENVELMNETDLHLTVHPTECVNFLFFYFRALGIQVSPDRIRRLMSLIGRETIYIRINITKLAQKVYIKHYLLKDLKITRANQIWCTDITYVPMRQGFMYLTAYIDVYSRKIVGGVLAIP